MFRIALVCFGIMVLGCVYSYYHPPDPQDPFYNAYLPVEIEASQVLAYGSEFHITEGCGAVVYELSQSTATRLIENGASVLKTGMRPRRHFDFEYGDWKPTPVASDVFARFFRDPEGAMAMHCADLGRWEGKIVKMASENGGFYALGSSGVLLLQPRQKRAVFAYDK